MSELNHGGIARTVPMPAETAAMGLSTGISFVASDTSFGTISAADMVNDAAQVFTRALYSAEGIEGTAAFTQKRKPAWVPVGL